MLPHFVVNTVPLFQFAVSLELQYLTVERSCAVITAPIALPPRPKCTVDSWSSSNYPCMREACEDHRSRCHVRLQASGLSFSLTRRGMPSHPRHRIMALHYSEKRSHITRDRCGVLPSTLEKLAMPRLLPQQPSSRPKHLRPSHHPNFPTVAMTTYPSPS